MTARRRQSKSLVPKASRASCQDTGCRRARRDCFPGSGPSSVCRKSHNYWITTVKPDGAPHTMVVWGLWLDGAFLFSTGRQSRKARNLEKNKNCVVCTEDAHEAVIVEGTAGIADVSFRRDVPQKVSA